MKRHRNRGNARAFWNTEYNKSAHFALSTAPSEDLEAFTRWLEREHGRTYLNPIASALDLGCGNGRNIIYLHEAYGMRGVGYDISNEAIAQAKKISTGMPLSFEARSIAGTFPLPDQSQTIVLDMMTSHFLNHQDRAALMEEIARVLRPDGWFLFKTFLLDEDKHAQRLLKESPGPEPHSYIHPVIGVPEYVFTEDELLALLDPHFMVHKVSRSHRHIRDGKADKRRSISIYAQKKA